MTTTIGARSGRIRDHVSNGCKVPTRIAQAYTWCQARSPTTRRSQDFELVHLPASVMPPTSESTWTQTEINGYSKAIYNG